METNQQKPEELDPQSWEVQINDLIEMKKPNTNLISDGYHTFGELYEHRIINFMAVCRLAKLALNKYVWRSKAHSDGEVWDGWFILGIDYAPGKQITYHLPNEKWDMCEGFAVTREKAPDWDGHTSQDVLKRLTELLGTVQE